MPCCFYRQKCLILCILIKGTVDLCRFADHVAVTLFVSQVFQSQSALKEVMELI